MPFPLIAAALAAAGNLGSAAMNNSAADSAASTGRRGGKLIAGKFSSPLSQYAGNTASSFHAPTSGLVF